MILNRTKGRIVLTHRTEDPVLALLRNSEGHGNGTDVQVERNGFSVTESRMIPIQPAGSTKRRMTSERQFLGRGKDAHLNATLMFYLGCAREDKCCLRQIGFTSEGLHLGVGEASRISEDG